MGVIDWALSHQPANHLRGWSCLISTLSDSGHSASSHPQDDYSRLGERMGPTAWRSADDMVLGQLSLPSLLGR